VDCVANAPLHLALAANNLTMVRLLVERGSRLSALNGNGRTPAVLSLFGLHPWWRNEEKLEILELLLNSGAEYKMLVAATLGDEVRVRELLRGDPSLRMPLIPAGGDPSLEPRRKATPPLSGCCWSTGPIRMQGSNLPGWLRVARSGGKGFHRHRPASARQGRRAGALGRFFRRFGIRVATASEDPPSALSACYRELGPVICYEFGRMR
jgi:ankyrin repeat protein